MDGVLVLWPDGPRHVSPEKVIGWAQDEWADADAPEHDKPTSLADAVAWLTDSGTVTFGAEVL